MNLAEEIRLYIAATPQQLAELRNVNDAHAIVSAVYTNHCDWRMFLPIPWNKWWAADRKMVRIAEYLFSCRTEALR